MRLVFALPAAVLAALYGTAATAQTPPLYYCDPLRIYNYPGAPNCPTPWRVVSPATGSPQPYAARSAPETAAAPQSARPSFPALGDGLDDWCKTVALPSSVAICGEPELRALMIERQHAYDEAKARLTQDRQKALLADQNGWVKTYPQACGLSQDAPPSLPLAPAIKDCMAQAGRARIAYLRAYAGSSELARHAPATPGAPAPAVSAIRQITPEEAVEMSQQAASIYRKKVARIRALGDIAEPPPSEIASLSLAEAESALALLPALPCALDPFDAGVLGIMSPVAQLSTDRSFGHDAAYRIREDTEMVAAIMDDVAYLGTDAFGRHSGGPTSDVIVKEKAVLADPVAYARKLCFDAYWLRELRTEITIAGLPAEADAQKQLLNDEITEDNRRSAIVYETPAQRQYYADWMAAIDKFQASTHSQSAQSQLNADLADAKRRFCETGQEPRTWVCQ